jgi:hypothetical protein
MTDDPIYGNIIYTPSDRLHYQTAVVDPHDDETIWMISDYAKDDGYHTVIGLVKP